MTRETPASERIADHFRSQIKDGVLLPGAKLPTIREIAETWSVARQTASNAVQLLRAEGLVTTGGRAGTVVGGSDSETMAVALDGVDPASIHSLETTTATEALADELGVRPGSAVVIVHFSHASDS